MNSEAPIAINSQLGGWVFFSKLKRINSVGGGTLRINTLRISKGRLNQSKIGCLKNPHNAYVLEMVPESPCAVAATLCLHEQY